MSATIRPYRPEDRDALFDICIRTGLNGGDATGHYRQPELLPLIFAAPYAEFDPELVFVVDNGERAVGYILGTADTPAFVTAFRERWLPRYADRYPVREGEPLDPDAMLAWTLHHPERMLVPELEPYPAHLHIDLLPSHQGQGWGRRLMHTFWDALRARGVPAVHLSMSPKNTRARAFYDAMGYHPIPVAATTEYVEHLGYHL